jgi:hypothetical protein
VAPTLIFMSAAPEQCQIEALGADIKGNVCATQRKARGLRYPAQQVRTMLMEAN